MTFRLRLAPKVPTRAAKGPCRANCPDSTLSSMAASGSAYMGASDAFSWYMERDPVLRSTVVAVVWLDRRPEWDVLVGRVDRLSRVMPSLRQHVVEPPFRLAAPRWTCDPDFDLSWHVCRVTVPGSRIRDAVLELARRSATEPFDRNRPLWRLTLVEGIKDGAAALIIKFHHSLSDGVGGLRALAILADLQREPADLGEMPPAPSGETLDSLALVTERVHRDGPELRPRRLARDRGGHPGPDPLRTRSDRSGLGRRRDGPVGLPDGRAERQHPVAGDAGAGHGAPPGHDRGPPGRPEAGGQDRRRDGQ